MSNLKLSSTSIIISNLIILSAVVAISFPAIKNYVDDEVISSRFQAIDQMHKVSSRVSELDTVTASQFKELNLQLDSLLLELEAFQKTTRYDFSIVEAAQNKEEESNAARIQDFNSSYSELAETLFRLSRQYSKIEAQILSLENQVTELKENKLLATPDPYNF
tara:strand:- start:396 stop:884 length:489 start_codon:yes stop_codon:yes gene_type:complete